MKTKLIPIMLTASLMIGFIFYLFGEQGHAKEETVITSTEKKVKVMTVENYHVTDWDTYTTRVYAPEIVLLRPRISGVIDTVHFKGGDLVNEGDILVSLDTEEMQLNATGVKSKLMKVKALYDEAKKRKQRAENLKLSAVVSEEALNERTTKAAQMLHEMNEVKAELALAKLHLSYAQIKSPITGKVSNIRLTKGNVVNANESILTKIISTQEMYSYVTIDEKDWYSKYFQVEQLSSLAVKLEVLESSIAPIFGAIEYIDNEVGSNSGAIKLRALFNNKQGILVNGAFVRISIAKEPNERKIIIPDQSIGTDLKNQFVMIVTSENKLQSRKVTIGKRFGQFREVLTGLAIGEVIAVNGPAQPSNGKAIIPAMLKSSFSSEKEYLAAKTSQPGLIINSRHNG